MPVLQRLAIGSARGFGFGVGGITYAASITELATGTDSISSTQNSTYQGSITELATGTDSSSSALGVSYWLSAFYSATSTENQYLSSVYVDADENIYATGMGSGNGAVLAVNVLKYDKNGALQWQRKLNATYVNRGYAITGDSYGNIYVAGGYDDTGNTAPPGGVRGFIVKLNSSGTIQWQNLFWPSQTSPIQQSNLSTRVYAITLDSSGNIYTTGYTNFSTAFLFVAKHDSSGNLLWFKRFYGAAGGTAGYSIKINSAGNLVVGGTYGYGVSTTYTIPLILVLDTSGNLLSSVKMQVSSSTGTQNAKFYSIALDSNNNIYATGINGQNSSSSAYGPIICKFDSSLSLLWTKYLTPSTTSTNYPSHGVIVDSLGNPYLSYFDGIADSVKMVKFDPSGTIQWSNKITTVGGVSFTGSAFPSNSLKNSLTSLIQVYVGVASSNAYGALAKVPLDGTRTGSYTVGPYGQPTTYASYTQTTTALNWFTETPTLSQLSPVMTTQTAGFTNYVTTQSSTTVFI